ncbi:MAG TPA: tripartite tricarboxylate transporter substrate-binding protein [Xanthobacteraceae bacterium]|nr:tripartite tricarboxylate transporter substrate-binding protein [Xanthobacteraceae bacterium]
MLARCISLCLALAGAMPTAHAQSVADFYRGQSISMVVSSSAGGGYDTLSRAVAKYLGRHIPGNPSVIVRNMPGAGGILAMNYLANVAPRDGLTVGQVQNNTPFEPLLGTKQADYDATTLTWLGTPSVETGLLIVWHTSPVKTIEDARRIPITAGASGANSTPSFYARLLNELLGLRLKIIPGYPGQNEAFLAMERGELDSYSSTFWSSLTSTKPDWIKEKKIRVLVQYGPEKEAELPDVPYGPDLVASDDDKKLFEAAYAPLAAGRPFVAPPGLPAERAAALRAGLLATFNDPDFLAEAARAHLIINKPTSGEAMQAQIAHVYQLPQRIVDRLRRIAQKQ